MVDPIELILRALEAGVTPDIGVQAMIPDEMRDQYGYFQNLVSERLQTVGGERLLEYYYGQPELWADTLAKALEQAEAGTDEELLDAAQGFMSLMDVRTAARGGYSVSLDEAEALDDRDDMDDSGLEDIGDLDDLDDADGSA